MSADLKRTVFATSRAAEFLERRALQSQTGRPAERFGDVVVKELLDNALDAAESAGVAPEIEVGVQISGDLQKITVTDNGPGMPPEVVERILDFNVTVSDKAAYRSPTRGLQGNAWKTLLGIPYALDVTEPVVIEAHGVRHEVAVSIDPAGAVAVRHDTGATTRTVGTSVTVPLPIALTVDIGRWVQRFATLNPHAALIQPAEGDDPDTRVSYKPTAGDDWAKPVPTDPTSPHWYDETALKRLVYAHIGGIRAGGDDMPLGEFIRSFAGLSSTAKAKAVKAAVPGIERVSDFESHVDAVGLLLKAMKAEARIPKPAVLGEIPEEHYRARLDQAYGVERFWFRRKRLDLDGLPWLLEVAVAETTRPGAIIYGVNYSATFGDPFGGTALHHDDIRAHGATSFLASADAAPSGWGDNRRAAVIHVACPAPEHTDKGKVALTVPGQVAETFAGMLASASNVLRTEYKRSQRDARAEANRQARQRSVERVTIKDSVYAVIPDAVRTASGGGAYPFPVRNLFYAVRDLVDERFHMVLEQKHYPYFRDGLVQDYQREHGQINGMYYDPRGELREPHTGAVIRLGTREVAEYQFPDHLYDKILYVEKEGLGPIFEAAQLAERYDMAIALGKGEPVEAVRSLFQRAEHGDYRLFVLHDADIGGYSIARTIAEATRRMPGYSVEVIDLGLKVGAAIERGMRPESFTRHNALPEWMDDRLTIVEREWFEGRLVSSYPKNQWSGKRVELNALQSGIVGYVEDGLAHHGATGKVVPPADIIGRTARAEQRAVLGGLVDLIIADLIDVEAIVDTLVDETADVIEIDRDKVVEALADNPPTRWITAVEGHVDRALHDVDDRLRERVRSLLSERGIGGAA